MTTDYTADDAITQAALDAHTAIEDHVSHRSRVVPREGAARELLEAGPADWTPFGPRDVYLREVAWQLWTVAAPDKARAGMPHPYPAWP